MSRTKSDLLTEVKNEVLKSRFIANNTLEIHYKDGSRAIRLHDTDILTFKEDKIILSSGGWQTVTTKSRINDFCPIKTFWLYQEKSQWFVKIGPWGEGETFIYYDGITFDSTGQLLSEAKKDKTREIKELNKRIKQYVNLLNKDNIPTPNNGDCWYCLMTTKDGQTLGEASNNIGHLFSHLDEGYIPGSLLVTAMKASGYNDQQIGFHYQIKLVDTFKRSLRKYLQKQLFPTL